MFFSPSTMGFAIASAGLLLFTWLYLYSKQRSNGLTPPGPPAYPIIGNLFDMPSKNQVKVFSRLASEYGSILYLNVIGQPIIIVSDIEVARDLLEKRSNVYSDRPTMRMAGEMVGWENTLVLQHYGPTFRAYRKHLFRIFGTRAQIEGFHPVFETAAHNMLADLLRRPKNFPEAFRRAAGAIILKIAYGYNIREGSDEFVARVEEAMVQFSKLFEAGGYLVDYIPFLKYLPEWFPGASFQKTAREYRTTLMNMADMPMDLVKNQIASGTAARSLVADEINEGSVKTEEDEHILKWTAASIYTGGTDTTFSAMQTFMLTMTLYPDAQKKAQREIDAVIGRERLLTMADRSRLPYVNALHSEVLRWSSVVPLGMPHRLTEDDVYNGFAFPKGTIIMPNIWYMLHDPEVYKNPMDFNPDRFIESPGHAAEQDPRLAIFGFGRRICPGLTLADATTWLECALILSTFSISKARDARGEEITPSAKYLDGTITLPQAFECEIKPRSPETEALIHALG